MPHSAFSSIADALDAIGLRLRDLSSFRHRAIGRSGLSARAAGSGKTRTGAEWVRSLAEAASVGRIALVGPTAADVSDTMVEGESGLARHRPEFEPAGIRTEQSAPDLAERRPGHDVFQRRAGQASRASARRGWCDELAAGEHEATWDMLQFGLRLGKRPRQAITTTPKPITF